MAKDNKKTRLTTVDSVFSHFKGSTGVALTKKALNLLTIKCLILLEPISGLEPLTY